MADVQYRYANGNGLVFQTNDVAVNTRKQLTTSIGAYRLEGAAEYGKFNSWQTANGATVFTGAGVAAEVGLNHTRDPRGLQTGPAAPTYTDRINATQAIAFANEAYALTGGTYDLRSIPVERALSLMARYPGALKPEKQERLRRFQEEFARANVAIEGARVVAMGALIANGDRNNPDHLAAYQQLSRPFRGINLGDTTIGEVRAGLERFTVGIDRFAASGQDVTPQIREAQQQLSALDNALRDYQSELAVFYRSIGVTPGQGGGTSNNEWLSSDTAALLQALRNEATDAAAGIDKLPTAAEAKKHYDKAKQYERLDPALRGSVYLAAAAAKPSPTANAAIVAGAMAETGMRYDADNIWGERRKDTGKMELAFHGSTITSAIASIGIAQGNQYGLAMPPKVADRLNAPASAGLGVYASLEQSNERLMGVTIDRSTIVKLGARLATPLSGGDHAYVDVSGGEKLKGAGADRKQFQVTAGRTF